MSAVPRTRSRGSSLLRRPLLHFLALGAVLFGIDHQLRGGVVPVADGQAATIVVAEEDLAGLREDFARQMGRAPGAGELRILIEDLVEEEILFREAVARGLDRDDRGVRYRLIQKMRFLHPDADRDDATLLREALALDLAQDDLVIRRMLVEKLRLVLARAGAEGEPDDATLAAYLASNPQPYRQPARLDLEQVYFDPTRRGPRIAADAKASSERLRAGTEAPGDPFLLERHQRRRSALDLERSFGPAFAAGVMSLEPGVWSDPIPSAYGLHVVRVDERTPAHDPPLAAVRSQLEAGWRAEQRERALEAALETLRSRYRVRVMDPAVAVSDAAS